MPSESWKFMDTRSTIASILLFVVVALCPAAVATEHHVIVRVSVNARGSVDRAVVAMSSGDADADIASMQVYMSHFPEDAGKQLLLDVTVTKPQSSSNSGVTEQAVDSARTALPIAPPSRGQLRAATGGNCRFWPDRFFIEQDIAGSQQYCRESAPNVVANVARGGMTKTQRKYFFQSQAELDILAGRANHPNFSETSTEQNIAR